MIKRFSIVFMAIALLIAPFCAYADAIMSNAFRWEHEDEIQDLEYRRFVVNGPGGSVSVKAEPGSEGEVYSYENGAEVFMDGIYIHNGIYWGVQSEGHYAADPGWIPMEHLLVVYTPADFSKENNRKFYAYTGDTDQILAAERLVLWQWPGSDREKRVLGPGNSTILDVDIINAYKDAEGREWGYTRVQYQSIVYSSISTTESWICLTEPGSSNIPPFYPAPRPTKWSKDGNLTWVHDSVLNVPYEQNLLSNIEKVRAYDNAFTDVSQTAWYRNAIIRAYEYEIIQGRGDNIFDPVGSLSVREALIIASRIHAYYKYGKEEGNRWLTVYDYAFNFGDHGTLLEYSSLRYCEAEGIIEAGEFDSYYDFSNYETVDAPVTRAQMVHVWSKILKPEDMPKQNTVRSLPDVRADTQYYADIILFYEAGIIGGVDAEGTFRPDSAITRAEAATIFMNLIDENSRHKDRIYG